ncbi:hypothetical protein HBI56_076100 [Parastagonospora nodorum]|uniref:Uncharacterized protein n=1 Tax=Phaeosphaeria nodorum (strain SN15 / ATCC MYA-4574 / FGSC 10173) TaxID=321614 RepID=A0A7U2EWB7_PHANO|nr:hypothetical protein HBH56_151060 [Parastagonospora nodorum]QRC94316.1 hypothetical protein JI435_405610 [Parastagonospora nodorum SN15]KAH3928320.1 hypothetical protein HBH54_136960 [Parastagonospora nodorum]KAH3945882.1 hypothetical protein HBH53_138520 [Parastagonospora nodorum]KAH3984062.1 hypothetical protein HBH52_061430 [Parastagonospora nodorum]
MLFAATTVAGRRVEHSSCRRAVDLIDLPSAANNTPVRGLGRSCQIDDGKGDITIAS